MISAKNLIRPAVNHGKPCWLADLPSSLTGKARVRKFFPSREAAESFAKSFLHDNRLFGQDMGRWLHDLGPRQRAELMLGVEKLARLGFTPLQAADFIQQHGNRSPSLPLGDLVERFLAEKTSKGCRPRYRGKLASTLSAFALNRREMPAADITTEDVRSFVRGNGWAPATRRSYLGDLRAFFGWAVRRKLLPENPAEAEEAPMLDDKPPGVLDVPSVRKLLEAAQETDPGLLPFLALGLFAGLRSQEILRLSADDILSDFVEVTAAKAKTRQRRLIPITPQLRAWLDAGKEADAKFPPPNWRLRWLAVRKLSGLRVDWPQNAARHSFVSYHFAKYKNAAETAALAGHSEAMLFRHYRALVAPSDADSFFGLLPDSAAVARGIKAALDRVTSANQRRGEGVRAWHARAKTGSRAPFSHAESGNCECPPKA